MFVIYCFFFLAIKIDTSLLMSFLKNETKRVTGMIIDHIQ